MPHYPTLIDLIMKLQHKVCVLTGGGAGIGRCLAETFLREGARVYLIDKEIPDCELYQPSSGIKWFRGDIARQQTLDEFADWVLEQESGIDILVNNACLMNGGILSDCSYEDFLYVQQVGVAAPYWLTKRFKPYFRKGASIVNLSSTRAFQSQPDTESYTAAKGGITALTHALAVSLGGIARVNSIAPGWIETARFHEGTAVPAYAQADLEQHPSRRIGEPEDIARAVLFLCDERNSFINGTNLTIDGGMSKLMVYHNDCGWQLETE